MSCECGKPVEYSGNEECRECYERRICRETRDPSCTNRYAQERKALFRQRWRDQNKQIYQKSRKDPPET